MGSMTERTWQGHFHPRWLLAAGLSLVCVLGLTHIPQEAMPRALQQSMLDKVEHVAAYGLVTGLFLLSLRWPVRPAVLLSGLAALAAIGVLDEVTQPWVHRQASIWDYAGDLAGIALSGVAFLIARCGKCDG